MSEEQVNLDSDTVDEGPSLEEVMRDAALGDPPLDDPVEESAGTEPDDEEPDNGN